jgi:hypothetical protein
MSARTNAWQMHAITAKMPYDSRASHEGFDDHQ